MRNWLLAATAALSTAACADNAMTIRGRFDSYGNYDQKAPSEHAVQWPAQVQVYYGTSPGGFSLRDNELKVEPGFHHQILGTVHVLWDGGWCNQGELTKDDVIARMRIEAQRVGGNAIIYTTSAISDASTPKRRCDELHAVTANGAGDIGSAWVVILDGVPAPTSTEAPPTAPTSTTPAPAPAKVAPATATSAPAPAKAVPAKPAPAPAAAKARVAPAAPASSI